MTLEINLLGRFAVRRDGEPVAADEFGGRLARELVRMLVTRRGQVLTREALIDALWRDQTPADPDANLNVQVNRARRALGDPDAIVTVAGGYVFSAAVDVRIDAERFEAYRDAARSDLDAERPRRASQAVRSALGLWRGAPLPEDTYAEWAQPYRDRLERAQQETIELGAEAALATGDIAQACDLAAQAVSQRPLREAAHLLHIRALAAAGDRAEALAAHDALRRRLAEELGIDPSPEAADVHRRLLQGDPVAVPSATAPRRSIVRATAWPPFVGREREIARLVGLEGEDRLALVSGRAGSGKSRLLHEVVAVADRTVLHARAVLPEQEASWTLARVLLRAAIAAGADPEAVLPARSRVALADLLPEMAHDAATAADARSRRALALEGAARLVTAVGPALIVVDDLQWADASSLDLLATVAGRADDVSMVLAYRAEDLSTGQDVATFIAGIRTTGRPLELQLGPLDAATVERLVADAEVAAVLAGVTDGTPFAVMEAIRTLEQQGALRRGAGRWHPAGQDALARARTAARAGQQRSIIMRADRQPSGGRVLLDMLALLGRPAPTPLLGDATGMATSDIDEHMGVLVHADLVRHDERGWALVHDLVGETLLEQLEAGDHVRLQRMLARALARHARTPGERARHLAGAGDRPAAAAAYATAARDHLERFADHEAGRLAGAGLELDPGDALRSDLLEVRAETRARTGQLPEARADLRAALPLTTAHTDRARLLTRLASLESGAEDLVRASNLIDLALADAADDPGARGHALAVAAIIDMNLERPRRAESRYAEALTLFKRVGDAAGVTRHARHTLVSLTLVVLSLALVAFPAAAAPLENVRNHIVDSEIDEEFCGDLTVRIDAEVFENILVNQRGADGLPYFAAKVRGTFSFTNLANDLTLSQTFTTVDKDLKVTDNGDGTLTILVLATGGERWYGPDGKLLFRNPGQIRYEVLIDHAGTPDDPSDDEFISQSDILKGSTGLNETQGRDFCDDVHTFIG